MLLYPRLAPAAARSVLDELRGLPLVELRSRSSTYRPEQTFYPTGSRAPEERLAAVISAVRAVVDELGFPKPIGGRLRSIQTFDQRVGSVLHREMKIVPADAASHDVWAFMSLVLLPDAAFWRYPEHDDSRVLGDVRNVFRRLWWRAEVLGDGPGDPPARLGEDQLVQIMERPTIGGDVRVARALAGACLTELAATPALPSMDLMRESAKRVIRLTAFTALGALPDQLLESTVREMVSAAASSLSRD